MVIYVIVCNETLKVYVGQHNREDDLKDYFSKKFYDAHRKSGKRSHLFNAMRKYPRDSWSIHPLISGIDDKKELDEQEQLLIYALKAQHPDVGYNICDGGEGFTGPHSEETKRKLSKAHLGKKRTEEQNRENGERMKKLYAESPEYRAQLSQKGRVVTAESREKMRIAHLDQEHPPLSEAQKQRIGAANKAGWTPERRKAWSEYKTLHNGMKGKTAWNKK
jgi:group I intron endonuclease